MPQSQPNTIILFDSKDFSWKDMSFTFLGVNIKKIQELTYGVEVEDEELYGAGDEPLDISRGNRKYFGQMIIYKSMFDAVNEAARLANYRDILDLSFPITCSYSNDTKITTDVLMGVHPNKFMSGGKQNDKSILITLPFKFTRLIPNKI